MNNIDQYLLSTGKFYKHLDGSVACRTCELTLNEGCACWVITLEKRK